MAELHTAQRHLSDALKRLEAALTRRLSAAPVSGYERALDAVTSERDALARDVAVLRSECDRLSAALREAEQENQATRQTTDAVVRRLDGSINEIDKLLES